MSRSARHGSAATPATGRGRPLLALLIALASLPASAQGLDHREMQARMDAAQAAANRPGDAQLGCDQLEHELVAAAKDPALQAHVAKSGADVQQKMAAMNAARGRAATQAALTIMTAVVPGAAMAGMTAMQVQAQSQQAEAARGVQQRAQQAQEMMAILPQMMRGQRVVELAQARQCDWVK